ncbi:phage protease, partial [Kingella kingae]|uniref:phage protease n=1 Tax=Kingella kingae TaxID=504 RepID=UPI001E39F35F
SKSLHGLAFLTSFVDNAQRIAALTQAQTAAQNVSGSLKTVSLSAEQKAACKMLGMSAKVVLPKSINRVKDSK